MWSYKQIDISLNSFYTLFAKRTQKRLLAVFAVPNGDYINDIKFQNNEMPIAHKRYHRRSFRGGCKYKKNTSLLQKCRYVKN